MTDLSSWLLEQIAADQAVAEAAANRQGARWFDEEGIVSSEAEPDGAPGRHLDMYAPDGRWMLWDCEGAASLGVHPATSAHIAANDPATTLARCKAYRAIVERLVAAEADAKRSWQDYSDWIAGKPVAEVAVSADHRDELVGLRWAVRALASVYADRPGFDPEWRLA
jgi:hypothetical protein